jgi:hypothetical protein
MNRIELVAKRQDDLEGDRPDYSVYAGEQLVGRVYCQVKRSDVEEWFWSVNALTVDRTIGIAMHGYAADLDDAKDKLRAAFEAWLLWARAVPLSDLKRPHVEEELKHMARIDSNAMLPPERTATRKKLQQ